MIEENCYHGTTTENAQNILEKNFNMPTRKKYGYWLGKGVYFFLEDIFAFKWCVHEYKKIYGDDFTTDNANMMSIIKATIEYDSDRILDLTYFKGQMIIDVTYKEMLKSKKFSKELLTHKGNTVCIVMDYLFDILNFGEHYDLVKQLFRVNLESYDEIITSREKGLPQYQLCVKSIDIIKNRVIFDYIGNINNYIEQCNKLMNSEPFMNIVQDNSFKIQDIKYTNDSNDNIVYIRGDENE